MASAELQGGVQAEGVAAPTSAPPVVPLSQAPGPVAVAQIRAAAQALPAAGKVEEAIDYSLAALAGVLRKMTEFERLLAQLRRQQARLRSERISPEQLALLLEELQQLEPAQPKDRPPESEARADAELEQQIERSEKEARAHEGRARPRTRGWRARETEREVHQVDVPDEERTCAACGNEKRRIGEDVTRMLEYVPAPSRSTYIISPSMPAARARRV